MTGSHEARGSNPLCSIRKTVADHSGGFRCLFHFVKAASPTEATALFSLPFQDFLHLFEKFSKEFLGLVNDHDLHTFFLSIQLRNETSVSSEWCRCCICILYTNRNGIASPGGVSAILQSTLIQISCLPVPEHCRIRRMVCQNRTLRSCHR